MAQTNNRVCLFYAEACCSNEKNCYGGQQLKLKEMTVDQIDQANLAALEVVADIRRWRVERIREWNGGHGGTVD